MDEAKKARALSLARVLSRVQYRLLQSFKGIQPASGPFRMRKCAHALGVMRLKAIEDGKRLTLPVRLCYNLTMRTKNTSGGQNHPSFIEAARRAQIIEC